MSSTPTKRASRPNNPSHLFASQKARNRTQTMTSSTIAEHLAAFKKSGGRIEVLGTTPFRARSQSNAFRSKATAQRKAPTPVAGAVAAQTVSK